MGLGDYFRRQKVHVFFSFKKLMPNASQCGPDQPFFKRIGGPRSSQPTSQVLINERLIMCRSTFPGKDPLESTQWRLKVASHKANNDVYISEAPISHIAGV